MSNIFKVKWDQGLGRKFTLDELIYILLTINSTQTSKASNPLYIISLLVLSFFKNFG